MPSASAGRHIFGEGTTKGRSPYARVSEDASRELDRGIVTYYQLVESRRVNGQPRQRLIAHLGFYPSVNAALRGLPREIRNLKARNGSAKAIAKLQSRLEHLRRLRSQGIA